MKNNISLKKGVIFVVIAGLLWAGTLPIIGATGEEQKDGRDPMTTALIMDDSDNKEGFPDEYENALNTLGYNDYQTFSWAETHGTWDAQYLVDHIKVLIWFTANDEVDTLDEEARVLIEEYLDLGGKLFVSGKNIAQELNVVDPDWLYYYLGANFHDGYMGSGDEDTLYGVGICSGTTIEHGIIGDINNRGDGISWTGYNPHSSPVFEWACSSWLLGGVKYERDEARCVFLSIEFGHIYDEPVGVKADVMERILDFLIENEPPVATNDFYSTPINTPLVVPAPGLLENDYDPDGWPEPIFVNSYIKLDRGEGDNIQHCQADIRTGGGGGGGSCTFPGELTVNSDGSFEYIPETGYVGDARFRYRISDGDLFSDYADVTITVTGGGHGGKEHCCEAPGFPPEGPDY